MNFGGLLHLITTLALTSHGLVIAYEHQAGAYEVPNAILILLKAEGTRHCPGILFPADLPLPGYFLSLFSTFWETAQML